MIEALIVVATIGILGALAIFAAKLQIAKGRDARRKSDLAKIQKALEDYMNDNGCYPDALSCGVDFKPYLSVLPCDPINNSYFNYFYSYDQNESCKSWYKIYTRLEYIKDPIIEKVGCKDGCGPSNNYNYWVSSPNMNKVERAEGEVWWPEIGGVVSSPTPTITSTPTPTVPSGVTLTPSPTPTSTPTPTPTLSAGTTPTPIPTPTCEPNRWACFATGNPSDPGECRPFWPWPICNQWKCPSTYGISDCGAGSLGYDPCDYLDNQCEPK